MRSQRKRLEACALLQYSVAFFTGAVLRRGSALKAKPPSFILVLSVASRKDEAYRGPKQPSIESEVA